jgi:hypothetical protein
VTDIIGNEIFKGAVVAYGVRSGNSGDLHVGVIADPETLKVVPIIKDLWSPDWRIGNRGKIGGVDRIVCIPFTSIPDRNLCDLITEVWQKIGL